MTENIGGYKIVTLDNLDGGQVVALFDREIKRVLENIADQNTPAAAMRTVTISIKIKPDEKREQGSVKISAKSTLADVAPSDSIIVFNFDGKDVTAYQSPPPNQLGFATVDEVTQHREAK